MSCLFKVTPADPRGQPTTLSRSATMEAEHTHTLHYVLVWLLTLLSALITLGTVVILNHYLFGVGTSPHARPAPSPAAHYLVEPAHGVPKAPQVPEKRPE